MAHPSGVATATIDPEVAIRKTTAWGGPLSILLMAGWFGLAAGLLELVGLVVRVRAFEKGFFLRSTHFVWMVPVSDLAIYGSWGLLLVLASWLGWRLPTRWVLGSFLFLACASQLLLVRGLYSFTCGLLSAGIAYRAALWIEPRQAGLWRLIRRGTPPLLAILTMLVILAIARRLVRSPPTAPRVARRGGSGPERPVDRPGHGPRRSAQPLRIRTRHDSQPHAAGESGRPFRPSSVGGALDAPLPLHHVHRSLAS